MNVSFHVRHLICGSRTQLEPWYFLAALYHNRSTSIMSTSEPSVRKRKADKLDATDEGSISKTSNRMTDKSGHLDCLSSSPSEELATSEVKQQTKQGNELDGQDVAEVYESYRHKVIKAERSCYMMRKKELVVRCIRDVLKGSENTFFAENYKGKAAYKTAFDMSDLKYFEQANLELPTVGNKIAHGLSMKIDAFLIRK